MHNILITLFTFSILVSCVKRNPTVEGMYINIGGEPTTLNPITSTDGYSSSVQAYSLEYLVTHDIDTYELKPALATSWKISPNKTLFNKTIIGTGPYILDQYHRGSRIVLKKNSEWWGRDLPEYKGENNANRVTLRFISDSTVSLAMLTKQRLDFIGFQPEDYVKKTNGKEWGKTVFKVKTENSTPKGYNFIGWNMKHPILKDRNVRKALFHLVNRDLMIEKFEYNLS